MGPRAGHQLPGPLGGEQDQGEPVVDEGEAVFNCDAGHLDSSGTTGGNYGRLALQVKWKEPGCP